MPEARILGSFGALFGAFELLALAVRLAVDLDDFDLVEAVDDGADAAGTAEDRLPLGEGPVDVITVHRWP